MNFEHLGTWVLLTLGPLVLTITQGKTPRVATKCCDAGFLFDNIELVVGEYAGGYACLLAGKASGYRTRVSCTESIRGQGFEWSGA